MDPVQQTLVQQNSGSANGAGFGQFFVEGARQGLMRRQIEGQEKQEERLQQRQDMMLPLEAQQTRLNNANLGIQAVANLRKGIAETQVNAALPKLYQLQIDFAQSPDGYQNKAKLAELFQLQRESPAAFYAGMPGATLVAQVQSSYLREAELKRQLGQLTNVLNDPLFGPRVKGFDEHGMLQLNAPPTPSANLQESERMIQLTRQRDALPLDDPRRAALDQEIKLTREQTLPAGAIPGTLSPAGKLATDFATMQGRPVTIADFEEAQARLDARNNMTITTGTDAAGRPTMSYTRGATGATDKTGLTTSMRTELQQADNDTLMALQTIDKLRQTVINNPNAWGPRGKFMELVETGQGILDPDAEASNKSAINEADISFSQLANAFRVGGGAVSDYEEKKLNKAVAITGWKESKRSAQDKLDNLQDAAVARQLRVAKALDKPVPDDVLRRVYEPELEALRKAGLLTNEDLGRYFDLTRGDK